MRFFTSAAETSSGFVPLSLVPVTDVTSSLTMSDNIQNPSFHGTAPALQLPLPVVSNAASLTGSVYSFSSVATQAVNSAWLLPSASATTVQPLMESAQQYQHSSMAMFSVVPDQSQMYMSAAPYPGPFQWGITESTESHSSHSNFPMTVYQQDTAIPSTVISAQYANTSDVNTMMPLYPSHSHSLSQGPPSHFPNQGHSLSLSYQQASQVYYYDQGTLGPVLSGELVPCLPPYGSVPYTGTIASAPQPEMVLVLKQVQPTSALPSVSTSAIDYSGTAEPTTEMSFQDIETTMSMETSLRVQPARQTFGQPKMSELPTCHSGRKSQIQNSSLPPGLGDFAITHPEQRPVNPVALAPTESQVPVEKVDVKETKTQLPLVASEMTGENHDPPWHPVETPDIEELLSYVDPMSSEKPGCKIDILEKNSLCHQHQDTLEPGTESSSDWADINKLVEDIQLPQLFNFLTEDDQYQSPTTIIPKDISVIGIKKEEDKSSILHCPCDRVKDKKHKASDPIDEAPKAKIQAKDPECLSQGRVLAGSAADSGAAPGIIPEASHFKPPEGASGKTSQSKGHGQEIKKPRGNQSKRDENTYIPGNKPKAEDKTHSSQRKRRRNAPELIQETCTKPRSSLALHMLESVQVYHALGKKCDKKRGLSSSCNQGNSANAKDSQASLAVKSWRNTPHGLKGQERPKIEAPQRESCFGKDFPSQCKDELPPPGKVKLVPLPFLSPERPQPRPVLRKPQSAASCRPTVPHPAQPAASHSALPTADKPAPAAPASSSQVGSARPAPSESGLGSTTSTQPSVPPSAASRPAASTSSPFTALQRDPVPTLVNKPQSPPKPQNKFLLEDFASQRIPWRKPNVPEPVVSTPITKEQRPEREAMKRQAQQERENAAKYTAWGRVQFFVEREKEMEISQYYGYVG